MNRVSWQPCLQMRGLTKAYGGVRALGDVSLQIGAGEVHALCGENGAGKSTLMNILYGLYHPDEGEILIKGERVVVIQSKNRRLGMGLIGQVIVSRDLVAQLGVKVMKSVGVCTEMDTIMHRMLRKHPGCRAVVYKQSI